MKPFSMMMLGKPASKAAPFDFSFLRSFVLSFFRSCVLSFLRSCVLAFCRFFVLAFFRSCNVIALVC